MKIIIPEQYRENFQEDVVYVTLWKRPSLLLTNKKERDELQETLQASRVCNDGTVENLTADVVGLSFDCVAIEVPPYIEKLLVGEVREFSECKAGLLVK